jgi:ATP-dependent Zn protease
VRAVDTEVSRILSQAHARALRLLTENRAALERVARRLYEAETLQGADVRALIRPEPVAAE